MTEDFSIVKPAAHSLSSGDVDFPDVLSEPNSKNAEETAANETGDFIGDKEKQPETSLLDTINSSSTNSPSAYPGPGQETVNAQSSNPLCTSLREQVRPGQSTRTQFPLVPSKAALLIIDIQEYLSSPSSVQDEEDHAYFYQTSLPRTVSNVEKLLRQMRQLRDSQSQGCEVIFTYLEALTQDSRDVSLDYKLSGPQLANLPNSPSSPATFLEHVTPLTKDGKGDIVIPKTSCSVFMSTNLQYVLQNLHVEQLLVCGQLTDQCVE